MDNTNSPSRRLPWIVAGALFVLVLVLLWMQQRNFAALQQSIKKASDENAQLRQEVSAIQTMPAQQALNQAAFVAAATAAAAAKDPAHPQGHPPAAGAPSVESGAPMPPPSPGVVLPPAPPRLPQTRAFVEQNHITPGRWGALVKANEEWTDLLIRWQSGDPAAQVSLQAAQAKRDKVLLETLGNNPALLDKYKEMEKSLPPASAPINQGTTAFSANRLQ